ncbi:amylo-alpha-1,6-glucosidase [Fimbriiglobus ruber]|uniref:Glycogen debranching enzyme-related protein n=1 Tax=Fimbriiglobus ruber TaxID=1908690 RepID=A0A225CZH9_9BACT|nr:amylo-alpha-1,6-glucosidase [Fimbriiglobus ruber]OWK34770.1 glycogen debranching enzyme-related protein [Fimbriiglobus ruber]
MPATLTAPSPKVIALDGSVPVRSIAGGDLGLLLDREWLVTNGLGGYACGTLVGVSTRRYHGHLIAAHAAPLGRVMMLNHLTEQFRFPDWSAVAVGGTERAGRTGDIHGAHVLTEFRLEMGLPVWRYEAHGHVLEKRVFMPYRRNTTHITYRLLEGSGPVRVKLRPSVHFRGHDAPVVDLPEERPYVLTACEGRYEFSGGAPGFPILRLLMDGESPAFTLDGRREPDVFYRVEENRGYEGVGSLWSPGLFRVNLRAGQDVTLTASTESWDAITALTADQGRAAELDRRTRLVAVSAPAARTGLGAELVLAADQFIITPAGRVEDSARAHAGGDEARTVIAGYHWFTDWGRDTMISLEGLTLTTGRQTEAGYILRTFAGHVKDGLIPNYFPDHEKEGVYHTADATLWFFHALDRYTRTTGETATLRSLLPTLKDIVAHHQKGTRFGIGVDPRDGLLRQGAPGYQLTWMDAKVGDWVVTPRRGKAVEINALWYNALRLLEGWLREAKDEAAGEIGKAADRARSSFNERYWCEKQNGLFDVIDGENGTDDDACRPNQIFAISLPNPVLDKSRWETVLETVRTRLLTPVGLRSLAPGHPDYKSRYYGDLRSRDAAYHQGTVWAWLIGPFIDAWLRVHPSDHAKCRKWLAGFDEHLSEACIGSISEVFDADAPYTARGCVAQAWSVAEVLRCWVLTEPDHERMRGV